MGLNRQGIAFLAALPRLGVDFERTLTIGRQMAFAEAGDICDAFAEAGAPIDRGTASRLKAQGGWFADPLLEHLGARVLESVDASGYEDATVVHDLNEPLPPEHRGAYSVVFDGGSLEHVFDFPRAFKTCLEAVAVGGHYVAITPVDSHSGHGFYQFTPELYFRALSPENGFDPPLTLRRSKNPFSRWYRVADPAVVGHRVERPALIPSLLYIAAKKVEHRPIFATPPQQSDYASAWSAAAATEEDDGGGAWLSPTPLRTRFLRHMPGRLRELAYLNDEFRVMRRNRRDFERVDLAALRLDGERR